ncbi:hypothetical protein DB345_06615 [Spartobacteria bacterium LR76]|nr:hypothetical protein DB345_06615 [Spartobacteria bacterium LR76]
MPVDFERPYLLFLIPLALALVWFLQRNSLAAWTKPQKALATSVRCTILALIIVALAGPAYRGATQDAAVVFLRDVSASVDEAGRKAASAFIEQAAREHPKDSGQVDFAAGAAVARAYGSTDEGREVTVPKDSTDLASALEFAQASLPADRPGRIVLLTDGAVNSGRPAESALARLKERGVELDVVPLIPETRPDAAVLSVTVPPAVREGETFDAKVAISSAGSDARATVRFFQNRVLVAEVEKELARGVSEIRIPNLRAEAGLGLYEATVTLPGDTRPENNRGHIVTVHGGAARTLLVDRDPAQLEGLAGVLRASGFQVEVRPASGVPATLEELEGFDLVMLSDVPAQELSDQQMRALASWVKDFGGGFLMAGGEASFGAGGYFRTPVAAMLPVRIERQEREETPVAALLVILDRSGSMSAMAGGQTKMSLANEGASLALEVLQARDLFGVFAVDTRVQQVVPLASASDKTGAARRIAGITSGGGGIYVYTSLAEAFPVLRDAQAKIKHIILFADAADAEEKSAGGEGNPSVGGGSSLDLAAAMLANRITLSVVALGREEDKDTAFLRDLAAKGGGRFYLTADATTLPRLFSQETMRATQSSLREDAFLVVPMGGSDVLQGIPWSEAPPLLGLNLSSAKPGADLLLAAESGEPVLAIWRYGLGQAAAFLSDAKPRWAAEWMTWPGYGKFWTQLARQLVRPDRRDDLSAEVVESGDRLAVDVSAVTGAGTFRNGLPVTVTVAEQGGASRSLTAPQVAPGRYRVEFPKPEAETAVIAVGDGAGRPISLAWMRDAGREFLPVADSRPFLEKLARDGGGIFQPTPEQVFRPAAKAASTRRDLSPWLLAAALLLWPVDIWLRRRDWT